MTCSPESRVGGGEDAAEYGRAGIRRSKDGLLREILENTIPRARLVRSVACRFEMSCTLYMEF